MNNIFTAHDGTAIVNMVCSILFCGFSFAYLSCYQSDILSILQSLLLNGQSYNKFVVAALITFILLLLQKEIAKVTELTNYYYSISFFPSSFILVFISHFTSIIYGTSSIISWICISLLLIFFYICFVYIYNNKLRIKNKDVAKLSYAYILRNIRINVFVLSVIFIIMCQVSVNNDIYLYRAHIEHCLQKEKYKAALRIAKKSNVADANITMLRIYALCKTNQLGERLFEYPITGGVTSMIPNGKTIKTITYPQDSIYHYIGLQDYQKSRLDSYFKDITIQKNKYPSCAWDYLLCANLLNRNLDGFVANLLLHYDLKQNLPKHYREALVLYMHTRSNPILVYHNNVVETDYQDFQSLSSKNPDRTIRKNSLRYTYGNTYWYYYQYSNS